MAGFSVMICVSQKTRDNSGEPALWNTKEDKAYEWVTKDDNEIL